MDSDGKTQLNAEVLDELLRRSVTRLTHFTASRNLPFIFSDGAIRPTEQLKRDVSAIFRATDPQRLDGHSDKICCSIEYPNIYYLDKAKRKPGATNYPDWACFFFNVSVAARPGTLFCPRNAAAGYGAQVQLGREGLLACYSESVPGAYGMTRHRGPLHRPSSPTDVQAEILVPGSISLSEIHGIALPTLAHIAEERARLEQLGRDPDQVTWVASEGRFSRSAIVNAITRNASLDEAAWPPNRMAP